MKRIILTTLIFCAVLGIANAQNSYWVFFTDKQNTTFDPYQYFDAKAMERYALNGVDLYDITNYPVNGEYAARVETACEELIGTSRWLNAAGVMATDEQIAVIRQFPFVAGVQLIASDMEMASESAPELEDGIFRTTGYEDQIDLHKGGMFRQHHITGKGVRIAVLDGGFKNAETHPAFQHLRDNHQIVKTWNFVKKKEDVYEAETHGRMVLSCIAGKVSDTAWLGMAPDAQFLLARTEVASEPKKEEVWWVQALEWADQNGADIVNSSLGYGKQRYVLKQMDGHTSIVAKAANTAARKGMLVCNSMGNEGDDKEWKMLITPADADSILSVGGVYSIDQIAEFSSFGPTADGRMKPNVVAMGHNWVAGEKGNYTQAFGTSFSSPMVAGFAACVKQLHPEYTAWQLKTEIEKSANHYPYFDYAFGYGVPQAGYFFGEKPEVKDNLTLYEDEYAVYISARDPKAAVFYKITNGDKTIEEYNKLNPSKTTSGNTIVKFFKSRLQGGQTLELWSQGQHLKYVVRQETLPKADSAMAADAIAYGCVRTVKTPKDHIYMQHFPKKYRFRLVLNASFMVPTKWTSNQLLFPMADNQNRVSRSFTFSLDNSWRLVKCYGLGFRLGFGSSWYSVDRNLVPVESLVPMDWSDLTTVKSNLKVTKFDLELFQRFFLGSAGSNWWYLDTGIFGEWNTGSRYKFAGRLADERFKYIEKKYWRNEMNHLDYGVRLRVGITKFAAIYGQYRISNILKKDKFANDLPKWEIGIQIF